MRNELNIAKVKVEFHLSKEVPVILSDKIQIQQVLLNLIQNAMDAMRGLFSGVYHFSLGVDLLVLTSITFAVLFISTRLFEKIEA